LIVTQRHVSEKYLNDSIRSELAPQAFDAGYHASSTEGCQLPVWDSSRWTHSGIGVSSPVSRHTKKNWKETKWSGRRSQASQRL